MHVHEKDYVVCLNIVFTINTYVQFRFTIKLPHVILIWDEKFTFEFVFKKLQFFFHMACCNWVIFDTWKIFMDLQITTCHHLGLIDVKVGTLWIGRDYHSTFSSLA
jgi:hypothetical protein